MTYAMEIIVSTFDDTDDDLCDERLKVGRPILVKGPSIFLLSLHASNKRNESREIAICSFWT